MKANMMNDQDLETLKAQKIDRILSRYEMAKSRRQNWQGHWQDCYDYALPQRDGFQHKSTAGSAHMSDLYDGTALDAVDQLAASMLGHLTPPWSQWLGLKPGPELSEAEADALAPVLEGVAQKIQDHINRSNFTVEIHQCFLDLAVGGTATLYFEETEPGAFSAFKFSSVPLQDAVLEEGAQGFLDGAFRPLSLTVAQLKARYPMAAMPRDVINDSSKDPQTRFEVLEAVLPDENGYDFTAILKTANSSMLLKNGRFERSPAISFRWMKSPGEVYGRSPVMKALPDIKTANKVVELILKNASIAVTGIWQADDDGVLNPANIDLVPGAIIPKAVGSQGLKALDMPGRFDVSELILKDLRGRIRHALLVDQLGPVNAGKMTATEVLERSSQMALLLGATYGRLQSELLTPLIQRAFSILKRRGEIPDIALDGRYVSIEFRSPLAQAQQQGGVRNVMTWLDSVAAMGPEASMSVDVEKTARYLGEALGVPKTLMRQKIISEVLEQAVMPQPIDGAENV